MTSLILLVSCNTIPNSSHLLFKGTTFHLPLSTCSFRSFVIVVHRSQQCTISTLTRYTSILFHLTSTCLYSYMTVFPSFGDFLALGIELKRVFLYSLVLSYFFFLPELNSCMAFCGIKNFFVNWARFSNETKFFFFFGKIVPTS